MTTEGRGEAAAAPLLAARVVLAWTPSPRPAWPAALLPVLAFAA